MGCSASQAGGLAPEAPVPAKSLGCRPHEHVVTVTQRDGDVLGLRLSMKSGRLLVRLVECGAIREWNAAHPGQRVKAGDELLRVNGVSGDSARMLTQLHTTGQLEINFRSASATPWSAPSARAARRCCQRQAAASARLVELPFVSAADLEDTTCCICLQSMEPDVRVLELPCMHRFHLACGAQWLCQKGTCPLCVRPLVSKPQWQGGQGC